MSEETKIRSISFSNYKEYYITIGRCNVDRSYLKPFLSNLQKKQIKIISITYSGNSEKFRLFSHLFRTYPTVIIGDSTGRAKGNNAGVYIHAIQGKLKNFKYIKSNREIIGTYFESSGRYDSLFLKTPNDFVSSSLEDFEKEVSGVYEVIEKNIHEYGFSHEDIYRFWNYMKNVNRNYSSFNKVRDKYFRKHKITDFPAATGIEAALPRKQNISISLEVIKAKNDKYLTIKSLRSDFQCEPLIYGPKFSRAKLLNFKKDRVKKIYVSGTSSVDRKGNSILGEDYEKNIAYVMSCAEHLLKKAGMSIENIVMSRVYFKNTAVEKVFEKIYRNKNWDFPYNFLFANICRDNLTFEIECIAAKPPGVSWATGAGSAISDSRIWLKKIY